MNMPTSLESWVTIVTQIVTTVTAVVVALLAYKEYLRAPEQEDEPESASDDGADALEIKELIVFRTSKQRTRLVVGDFGLECHLDDDRSGRGGHQWTLSKVQIAEVLRADDYSVKPGYKVGSGLFSIGPKRNWLYSKKLFPEPEYLHGALTDILTKATSIKNDGQ